MVEFCHNNHPDITHWSDDGLKFIVKDSDRLGSQIIPQYFRHSKYSSFFRQLNFYGFTKKSLHSSNINLDFSKHLIFDHKFFRRGHAYLLPSIRRSTCGNQYDVDEIDVLKEKLTVLGDRVSLMKAEFEKKMETLNAEFNSKVSEIVENIKQQAEESKNSRKRQFAEVEIIQTNDYHHGFKPIASRERDISALSVQSNRSLKSFMEKIDFEEDIVRQPSDRSILSYLLNPSRKSLCKKTEFPELITQRPTRQQSVNSMIPISLVEPDYVDSSLLDIEIGGNDKRVKIKHNNSHV